MQNSNRYFYNTLKLVGISLLITVSTFGTTISPIYLIGEHHDNPEHNVLKNALISKARNQKIILGVECPVMSSLDLRCNQMGICELDDFNDAYVFCAEDMRAVLFSHLLYVYAKLMRIQMCERLLESPSTDSRIKALLLDALEYLWSHDLCVPTLRAVLSQLPFDSQTWNEWKSIKKGPVLQAVTQDFVDLERRMGQRSFAGLLISKVSQHITGVYNKSLAANLFNELEAIIPQFGKLVLADERAQHMPSGLVQQLIDIAPLFEKGRSLGANIEDFEIANEIEGLLTDFLGDRVREFFMVQQAVIAWQETQSLGVLFLMINGLDHVPGLYMFFKKAGVPVEVGLTKNTLKLTSPLFKQAKQLTLPNLIKMRIQKYREVGQEDPMSSDIADFFAQEAKTNNPLAQELVDLDII